MKVGPMGPIRPEDRPAEAERIAGEVSEIVDAIQRSGVGRRAADHDWRRWLAEHVGALMGVLGLSTLVSGALIGRVISNDEREHEEFRSAIVALQEWRHDLSQERAREQERLLKYTVIAEKNATQLEQLLPEMYLSLGREARDRGDWPAVERLEKKRKAVIAAAKAGGQ